MDTTRVDRFGLKLALLLHGHDGSNQKVGENYATFTESRAATFARFGNSVPAQFKELATDQAPYRIPSPGNDPAFQPGGAYANYFTSYAAAERRQLRFHGADLRLRRDARGQSPAVRRAEPARRPASCLRAVEPGQLDAGQSSDISITNPRYLVVAVGW